MISHVTLKIKAMKNFILSLFIISTFLITMSPTSVSAAVAKITTNDLLGRLVLQVENGNKLWYIDPTTKKRWYLHNDADLQKLIKEVGVKPTSVDFSKLAIHARDTTPPALLTKYAGKIIISPDDSSKIFFLNKADSIMYGVGDFNYFYTQIGKVIAARANDSLLRQLVMANSSESYDPTFYGIAYAKFDGLNIISSNKYSQSILPLASLSKVMTAMVFLESEPDWDQEVIITQEEINYPCTLQLCGTTSEIDLRAGDRIKIKDLWVGMLSASSNQSAYILANHSSTTTEAFVKQMNNKAKSLGLKKTKFVEMSGLSADNVSTAEEFAKIAKEAFGDLRIADATGSTNYTFNVIQSNGQLRKVTVNNRNYSLLAMGPRASKSGYLVEAQRNAAVEKDGHIIVALHCYSLDQRNSIISNLINTGPLVLAN